MASAYFCLSAVNKEGVAMSSSLLNISCGSVDATALKISGGKVDDHPR